MVIELATDVQFARDLAAGGVFVPGCVLRLAQECDLLVCGANHQVVLPARVVYVDEHRGAGLELVGFSTEMKAQLAELEPMLRTPLGGNDATNDAANDAANDAPEVVESAADDSLHDTTAFGPEFLEDEPHGFTAPVALVELEALDDDVAVPMLDHLNDDGGPDTEAYPRPRGDDEADTGRTDVTDDDDDARYAGLADGGADPPVYPQLPDYDAGVDNELDLTLGGDDADHDPGTTLGGRDEIAHGHAGAMDDPEDDGGGPAGEAALAGRPRRDSGRPFARNVHERLRGLNLAAQIKLAVSGELHERIVLERLYGKNVWETLLRNPRLTAPEVSRIARYGSLPRVLLEIIVGNNAWLQIPEVRRALLSNPRLATDQVVKVLRLTPKHELKLATVQTAYPVTVRNVAKMLLRDPH